jgi:hypothetical protein
MNLPSQAVDVRHFGNGRQEFHTAGRVFIASSLMHAYSVIAVFGFTGTGLSGMPASFESPSGHREKSALVLRPGCDTLPEAFPPAVRRL